MNILHLCAVYPNTILLDDEKIGFIDKLIWDQHELPANKFLERIKKYY